MPTLEADIETVKALHTAPLASQATRLHALDKCLIALDDPDTWSLVEAIRALSSMIADCCIECDMFIHDASDDQPTCKSCDAEAAAFMALLKVEAEEDAADNALMRMQEDQA
ncbi:hypothetical protein RAZWK3B_15448 [Roseobacter sp. AzwK-3b]|uniref:hypothetical protein n=1 Tax=Roseobacter sp. AzwK-3b TaxID=351016 RepID=UPI000156A4D8|nr:hypothetical protein [Roseobacter sp. AzwK-3b]EDM70805.1 hypothetical protein RAZWK3B_15448 [Roseobacter sp. AzwK-3b]